MKQIVNFQSGEVWGNSSGLLAGQSLASLFITDACALGMWDMSPHLGLGD